MEEVGKLPSFLSRIQYADFTKSYHAGVRSLVRALQAPSGPKPNEIIDPKNIAKQVAGEVAKLLGLEFPGVAAASQDQKLVFVIMSFSPDMEPIFDGIASAASAVGLDAKRVKDVEGDYRITDMIIGMIESARLVVKCRLLVSRFDKRKLMNEAEAD